MVRPELANELCKKAYARIKGFEVMRMFRKGQFGGLMVKSGKERSA